MYSALSKIILLPLLTISLSWAFVQESQVQVTDTSGDYPEQLTGTFTGGFGEVTCHDCHFDYPVNDNPGWGRIRGLPKQYRPDSTYLLTVITGRTDLEKAGFQLSARSTGSGEQAGRLNSVSERTTFTHTDTGSVQYLQHSESGTEPNGSQSSTWRLSWTSPASPGDTVLFNVAVNAGNGDASAFGDYINTDEMTVYPPGQ